MILLIDNYDSFTYNLAQYFGELGCELVVRRNDAISLKEIGALAPERICISPGPCTPREAGISKDVILTFGARTPILGVCLGHQCIAEAYGGEIVRASRLMHGKASTITHNGNSLFSDLATSFEAGRYHSLVVKRTSLPAVSKSLQKATTEKSWRSAIANSPCTECSSIPSPCLPMMARKSLRDSSLSHPKLR